MTNARASLWPKGGSAAALGFTFTCFVSAVAYSHYEQVRQKAVMRAGVERDRERLRLLREQRKRDRQLQQQVENNY